MKRDDCAAAVTLYDEASSDCLDDLWAELVSEDVKGYNERVFTMCVELRCDAGAETHGEVTTDLETGRRIITAARQIIAARRKELGMEEEAP